MRSTITVTLHDANVKCYEIRENNCLGKKIITDWHNSQFIQFSTPEC